MAPAQVGGWSLAGRETELRAVDTALAADGGGGVAMVGAAGVGKTRLAREALTRWSARGREHEWVVATRAAASIPFGALSHLLPDTMWSEGSQVALLARVGDRFTARTASGPVLAVVDDAHLLDRASAALLHQLAAQRLVVPLVTTRHGEPVDDAVAALCRESALWLRVGPLPPEAVDDLLDQALGRQIDPISRRRLHRLAAGNPLLLRELLADAKENGTLVRKDGVWRWRGPVPGGARVAELVAARLRALDPATRQVLETIACGEPLALAMLERLADSEDIAAAERSGMAVVERSGARVGLRLTHPLYGEVLRAGLPVARARAIWGRLAAAMAEGPRRRRDDAFHTGVWRLQSGTAGRPEELIEAAEKAIARFDLGLAERLARAARDCGAGADADWLLARILTFRGRGREAVAMLPAVPGPTSEPPAMQAVTRALILYWGLGRTREAEQALEPPPAPSLTTLPGQKTPTPATPNTTATNAGSTTNTAGTAGTADAADAANAANAVNTAILASAADEADEQDEAAMSGISGNAGMPVTVPSPGPELFSETESTRSWILLFDGRCGEALRVAEEVLAMPCASDRAVVWAAMGGTMAAGLMGRLGLAMSIAERGGRVADAHAERLPWARAQVGYGLCLALDAAGRLPEATELAERGYQEGVASDAGMMTAVWAAFRGMVAKARGDLPAAQAVLREAVTLLEEDDTYGLMRVCVAELAGAMALAGDAEGARVWLARADEHAGGANRMFDARIMANRAWAVAAGGLRTSAAGMAERAAGLARDTEQPAMEAVCLYDAARLGAPREVRERLAELAAEIPETLAPHLSGAATALAAGDPRALEEAAHAFADRGHLLLAAETARAAAGAYVRSGLRARSRSVLEFAAVLAEKCATARTPLLEPHGLTTVLTRREREVARLAGTLPSREIAARLGLSVNTVSNTLARVYTKLGITGRGELAALFTALGTDRPPTSLP
ncbi:helix-turn-helix transcriptional regulator [Sphaerisporangium corydalis]|uniref:AAA family ATPase n=1 Tax=Sphaerisporangium corydalis TaxID=1441875 RepID=A0ABV9E8Z6_9ACTN|nr:LuxR family transcriptional regulator [Sphaerisporangium corydalis]